jgi:hypothetical protein
MLIQFLGYITDVSNILSSWRWTRDDSCNIVPTLWADDREIQVPFLAGASELFLMLHKIGHGTHLLEVKRPECEADYSPTMIEISGTISPLLHTPRWYRAQHSTGKLLPPTYDVEVITAPVSWREQLLRNIGNSPPLKCVIAPQNRMPHRVNDTPWNNVTRII